MSRSELGVENDVSCEMCTATTAYPADAGWNFHPDEGIWICRSCYRQVRRFKNLADPSGLEGRARPTPSTDAQDSVGERAGSSHSESSHERNAT